MHHHAAGSVHLMQHSKWGQVVQRDAAVGPLSPVKVLHLHFVAAHLWSFNGQIGLVQCAFHMFFLLEFDCDLVVGESHELKKREIKNQREC